MGSKQTKVATQADPVLQREVVAIRRLKKRAASHGKRFITDIAEIGKRLARVKDRVGPGNFLSWVRKNFEWSADTAENYISVYKISQTPRFRSLRNLPLEVLYLLGRRTVSEAAREAIAEQVEAGKKVTLKVVKNTVRIESPFYQAAKTVAPAAGEAVHTIRPPIPQEAVRSNVRLVSPEYAPPDCEQTRRRFNEVCHVGDSIDEWFAAGDGADDLSDAERETLIKAFGKIKQFVEVLTQAPRGHSSVN